MVICIFIVFFEKQIVRQLLFLRNHLNFRSKRLYLGPPELYRFKFCQERKLGNLPPLIVSEFRNILISEII